jgi:hypothetical protein
MTNRQDITDQFNEIAEEFGLEVDQQTRAPEVSIDPLPCEDHATILGVEIDDLQDGLSGPEAGRLALGAAAAFGSEILPGDITNPVEVENSEEIAEQAGLPNVRGNIASFCRNF